MDNIISYIKSRQISNECLILPKVELLPGNNISITWFKIPKSKYISMKCASKGSVRGWIHQLFSHFFDADTIANMTLKIFKTDRLYEILYGTYIFIY